MPAPFGSTGERDEMLWQLQRFERAAAELELLRIEPTMKPYLLVVAGTETPLLPSAPEMIAARNALQQAVGCLRHRYLQRCRDYDDEDLLRPRKPGDLDDERPF